MDPLSNDRTQSINSVGITTSSEQSVVEQNRSGGEVGLGPVQLDTTRATARRRISGMSKIKSAVLKGLAVATLIGATIGIGSTALSDRHGSAPTQVKPHQVQVVGKTKQAATASPAALEAARLSKASIDSLSEKSLAKQTELLKSLDPSKPNLWRDTPAFNRDGTVNAYVEISLGSRDKYELDIEKNELALDRVIHESVGGYPINYGIIPGTFSWDADPFDVVVLGPKLDAGAQLKGKIVGIYHMIDEKGFDPHLVISPVDANGKALFTLDDAKREEISAFVNRYKKPDAAKGKWARMVGWGDAQDGLRFTETAAGFFSNAKTAK